MHTPMIGRIGQSSSQKGQGVARSKFPRRARTIIVASGVFLLGAFAITTLPSRSAAAASAPSARGSIAPLPYVLTPSQVSPPAPALRHVHPPVPASPHSARVLPAVSSNCSGEGDVSGHAYATGFTTCGSAEGAYMDLSLGSSPYALDSSSDAHVNATLWYAYFTSAGAYQGLEIGYWKDHGSSANNCYYAGTYIGSTYTGHCLEHAGATPGGTTFEISYGGSDTYAVYLGGYWYMSFTIPTAVSHRLTAGWEEQADSLVSGISGNESPTSKFSSLEYENTSAGWAYWGAYSHCLVDYSKSEGFASVSFATAFKASIGPWAGSYAGCNGAAPGARTSW